MAKKKIKTHKATKKRFKITGSGKVMHWKQGDNAHLRTKKTLRRKRRLAGAKLLANSQEVKRIKRILQK